MARIHLLVALAIVAAINLRGCQAVESVSQLPMKALADSLRSPGGIMLFNTATRETPETQRRYALFIPPGLLDQPNPPTSIPCIVFLHGRGECGTDGLKQCLVGLIPVAMSHTQSVAEGGWGDFLIIAPQKPDADSTWESHESLVLACLEHAKLVVAMAGHQVDPKRICLTGLSQGGAGTWAIAAKHPELFAAIAPICGFVNDPRKPSTDADEPARKRIAASLAAAKMPVWAFHGEQDDIVRPEQTRLLISALTTAGWTGDVRATYYAEANHNSWDKAYRDDGPALAKWFLSRVSSVSEAGAKQ